MTKALLIHQVYMSSGEAGGTRHAEFGRHLAARGDALVVVASQVSYLTGRPVDPARRGVFYRETTGGVEVLRCYTPAIHNRGVLPRLLAFLVFSATSFWAGLRCGPVDLVMGTTPPIFQALSAWGVAAVRRKPFLLEVRDLWPEFMIDMGVLRNPVLIALARAAERFLYRRADRLLVNSPAYRDYLVSKGIPEARVSLVSNGTDVAMFDPAATGASFRERYGLAGKFLVVYAGAHGKANDLPTALDAAHLLRDRPEVHFAFVGDGMDRARLEAAAAGRGLANVTFTGPLPKSQMPEVLGAADACLAILMNIKMFRTTYPNKVFDYMAAGRPTLLAIDGVIREVIEAAGGGVYVPPGDAAALAGAVRSLADDPEAGRRMGRAARDYVARHFDRAAQAEEFRRVLQSLATGVAAPEPRLRPETAEV